MHGVQTVALTRTKGIDYAQQYANDEPDFQGFFTPSSKGFDKLVDDYSEFLHDGDFTKYQGFCYSKKVDYDVLYYIEQELARIYWINNRFTQYGSNEWKHLSDMIQQSRNRMVQLKPVRKDLQRSMIFDTDRL